MMRARMNAKATVTLALHAFLIWIVCGLTVTLGREFLGLEMTLWVHAIVAPAWPALVSLAYFNGFRTATPLQAASFFVSFIIILDAVLVAPIFEKSYAMFSSILGTWLPFLPIFAAAYFTGISSLRRRVRTSAALSGRAK
jgi:hypothetical protein